MSSDLWWFTPSNHYNGVIMSAMVSQITSPTIVYSSVYSGADQRKHQSSASLAFVRRIHRWPVNSPHKGPMTRKMFPFNDVIMWMISLYGPSNCQKFCDDSRHQIFSVKVSTVPVLPHTPLLNDGCQNNFMSVYKLIRVSKLPVYSLKMIYRMRRQN